MDLLAAETFLRSYLQGIPCDHYNEAECRRCKAIACLNALTNQPAERACPERTTMCHPVEVGQVFIAADGSRCGHLVTDVTTFAHCDDVVTTPFTPTGWAPSGNRIDIFKLTRVRYYLVPELPSWAPPTE